MFSRWFPGVVSPELRFISMLRRICVTAEFMGSTGKSPNFMNEATALHIELVSQD